MLVVQGLFGFALLAFGQSILGHGGLVAAAVGTLLAAVNAMIFAHVTWSSLRTLGARLLLPAGVFLGGAVACLGASLPPHSAAWAGLTLLGVFWNLELCRATLLS
jgi:hypothetical protein